MVEPLKAIPVGSYSELQQQIANLPPSPEGKVRLFRGQTRDYGTLFSSLGRVRATRPGAEAFDMDMRHLHIKGSVLIVLGDLLKLPQVSPSDIRVSAADFVMAEALVQHYGYQTRYIDVSPSVAHRGGCSVPPDISRLVHPRRRAGSDLCD